MATNAYEIMSHEMDLVTAVVPVQDWDEAIYEKGYLFEIVFATSHSKAKYLFVKHCGDDDLTFADIQYCRIVLKDVNRAPGIMRYDDCLWPDINPDHVYGMSAEKVAEWYVDYSPEAGEVVADD